MIKLTKVELQKYKSFTSSQTVDIEKDLTVLVGMNESGKTSILECLAKTNYFENDSKFNFNLTLDYPRKEKKNIDKSGEDPIALICKYEFTEEFIKEIENQTGIGTWAGNKTLTITSHYSGTKTISGVKINFDKFIKHLGLDNLDDSIKNILKTITSLEEYEKFLEEHPDDDRLQTLKKYYRKNSKWNSFIEAYVYREIISPNLPKFIYYDEYYQLPSRIVLEDLLIDEKDGNLTDDLKTAKALLDLADINIDDLINSENFEEYIAELESTEAAISDTLFQFWSANKNLNIEFKIDKQEEETKRQARTNNGYTAEVTDVKIVNHILDIRVKNTKTRVSLPLQNRSKGFNWFFSFLVWFNKIQADPKSKYILLLDEPGLNLHATAQADLLNFLESLTNNYQIIYTTHSPFMVKPTELHRVRTVFSDSESSTITDSVQQKDPNTLFPLQAALGYDIAQNLFISKKNLLVEGVSDLLYLTTISEYFKSKQRTGLSDDITIVPTGGLDKVASFISLLRGSKLAIVCLLDSFTDQRSKSKLDKMITGKIISDKNIKFFHDFLEQRTKADIEDIFTVDEYLNLFNESSSGKYDAIKQDDLDPKIEGILDQINKLIGQSRFNHFVPANKFVVTNYVENLAEETLKRFESIFKEINSIFK